MKQNTSNQKQLPISEYQKRFFLEWALAPHESTYNVALVNKITGNLNSKALKQACEVFIKGNEVIHAQYQEDGNYCYYGGFEIKDFYCESTFDSQESVESQIKTLLEAPFNLMNDVLFKFYLIKNENKNKHEFYFVLIAHHIIADAITALQASIQIQNAYNLLSDRKTVSLEINKTFTGAVESERNIINKDYKVKSQKYWLEFIGDFPLSIDLPYRSDIKTKNQVSDNTGEFIYFELSSAQTAMLKAYSKQKKTTIFIVLAALYGLVISKYSNQEKLLLSYPINMRPKSFNDVTGCFVNNIPLKIDLSRADTLDKLIELLSKQRKEVKQYQGYSLTEIIQDLRKHRDEEIGTFFNVGFIQANLNTASLKLKNLHIVPVDISQNHKIVYEVGLLYDEYSSDVIKFRFEYRKALFYREFILQFINLFKNTLLEVINGKELSIKNYSLLNREEQKKIIYDWNATDKEYPKDKMSYQLFEEQVKITPDNNALVYEGQQLTYKELNEKSNQLAHYIRKQYEKRTKQPLVSDTLIALCLDRSLEMVVGILAVLKAGGAYVPMDPAYPKERIDHILEDIRTELILTQRHLAGEGMQLPLDKVIYIELTEKIYKEEERSNLPQYSKATNLAYVIYTSGTTGKPKGVEITFSNLNNLIFVQKSKFEINSKSKVLQFASLVFDASVWEIFSALSFGAQLSIVSTNIRQNVHLLCDYLEDHQINVATLPPVLLNTMPHKKFSTLRILIVAGESCPTELMVKWSQGRKLINAYGPTENTVCATMHEFREGDINTNIGKPLDNVSVYVLDNTSNSVPIGVIGELYIGGAGLSRGYLNRPDLTSERFIVNPFATESDHAKGYARLYKTGDLVRWLSDGNLEYIGRNDDQVKIRGHRIELGEIENVLSQITGIKQSCVLAKERKIETGSPKYLVAYYVLDNKSDVLSQTTIRDKLAQMLPEYMVPSILVAVETFPLTINGKLDKQALPDPDFGYVAEEYVIPTNEIETTLSKIWQEVLGLERVGITDNFFRIGGDSILSIQVSSRIRQAGFNCQVKDIFEYKIIAKLAEHLSKKNSELALQSEQGILTGDAGLLPIQQWFLEKVDSGELVHPNHWNQSFLVRVEELETTKLVTIVEELVDYHDVLRMTYIKDQVTRQSTNGEAIWKQVYQSSIEIPELRILNVSKHGATEIQQILTSWQSEFDLERGPLFQVGYLYGYEDGSARIYFALHHTIVDGVSWRILTDDIKSLYEGRRLTPKGSSYRQWVESVKSYTKEHLSEADYWRTQLNAIPDYHKGVNEQESSVAFIELDKKLTRSLLQEAPKAYHTEINDLLLTTLAYALKEINGNAIQGVTLEGHGREEIDATIDHSRTVGWFTSVFPVKLELQNNLEESIRFIKESLRSIPNKGLCFGVFATSKAISYTYKDLAPISFNYLGQFDIQEGYWQIVSESSGESIHPANTEQNLISINGMVSNGKLMFSVVTKLGDDTTKQLSAAFKTHLTAIIEHCNEKLEKEGSSYTPSDFQSVLISQTLLNELQSLSS